MHVKICLMIFYSILNVITLHLFCTLLANVLGILFLVMFLFTSVHVLCSVKISVGKEIKSKQGGEGVHI